MIHVNIICKDRNMFVRAQWEIHDCFWECHLMFLGWHLTARHVRLPTLVVGYSLSIRAVNWVNAIPKKPSFLLGIQDWPDNLCGFMMFSCYWMVFFPWEWCAKKTANSLWRLRKNPYNLGENIHGKMAKSRVLTPKIPWIFPWEIGFFVICLFNHVSSV